MSDLNSENFNYTVGYDDGYEGRQFQPEANNDDDHIAYEEGFSEGTDEREANDSCYQQELDDFYGSTIFDQARLFE